MKKKIKCSNCNAPIQGKVYDILGDKYCETCYNKYNKIGAIERKDV